MILACYPHMNQNTAVPLDVVIVDGTVNGGGGG